jgi:hypothetical protein
MSNCRRGAVASLLLFLAASPASAAPPQTDERVGAEVLAALASGAPVEVIVTFDLPEAGPRDQRRTDTPAARAAIQSRADGILNAFGPGEFTLSRRYSVLPSLAGTLENRGRCSACSRTPA